MKIYGEVETVWCTCVSRREKLEKQFEVFMCVFVCKEIVVLSEILHNLQCYKMIVKCSVLKFLTELNGSFPGTV